MIFLFILGALIFGGILSLIIRLFFGILKVGFFLFMFPALIVIALIAGLIIL